MLAEMVSTSKATIFGPNPLAETLVAPGWAENRLSRARLEHLAREIKELTMLYQVGLAVGSSLDLEEVLWTLYRESSRLLNTANFALAIYDDQAEALDFRLVFDQGEQVEPFSIELSKGQGLAACVLTSQAPLLIRDMAETGHQVETDAICPDQPIRSWLGIPIRNPVPSDEEAQGVMVVWSYRPDAFNDHDLWLLSAVGAQAAVAIRNARLFQASQRRAQELAALNSGIAAENAHLRESVLAERGRVAEAQEQVRRELARDLHDGPTQLISAIMMQLAFCQKALEKDPSLIPEQIIGMQDLAGQAIHQMRTMLFELRPLVLETQGLEVALEVFLERRQEEVKTAKLSLNVETCQPGGALSRQEAKVEAALFAVVQEAVNNALKHARADNVLVHVKETPTAIHVVIEDDGVGFDVERVMHSYARRGSLGVVNIQERVELIGGQAAIQSAPGQGTQISIYVPKL